MNAISRKFRPKHWIIFSMQLRSILQIIIAVYNQQYYAIFYLVLRN